MSLPNLRATPTGSLFGIGTQATTTSPKKIPKRKRQNSDPANERDAALIKERKLKAIIAAFEAPAPQEVVQNENVEEEPPEMTRLEALEEKTKELQGYLNQLQDAVTIGMFQLRDLKKQVAAEIAALAAPGM
ncbi:hypothetical protein F4825DRAFT_453310 [Nemania diffusa]|nr:hypothetical protein F4825DRAFT_453310 [Nemania diffusa]